jgi:trans-feruloyl-CoA hydratase/vanillin synthase
MASQTATVSSPPRETVRIEREPNGLTWVILDRPEKRNAMNPRMHFEMVDVLDELEHDDATRVVVLTGEGDAWCAGNDLKEFFREMDDASEAEQQRVIRASNEWRWLRLRTFAKPTIAMVNGYCFGGGFTQLVACDLAIAAEDAIFGLSEVNWGVFPGGLVSRVLTEILPPRDGLYYVMTGETFDGSQAAQMRLVNRAVPREELRAAVEALAETLLQKSPEALRTAKVVYKTVPTMDYMQAEEYMKTKHIAMRAVDTEHSYEKGLTGFLDDKSYRPGFGAYDRPTA